MNIIQSEINPVGISGIIFRTDPPGDRVCGLFHPSSKIGSPAIDVRDADMLVSY